MKNLYVTDCNTKNNIILDCFNYHKNNPNEYIEMLNKMTKKKYGIFGFDPYTNIMFSELFEPYEEEYFGERKVRLIDDTYFDKISRIVEINYEEFYEILTEQSNKYISEHPNEKQQVEELMQKIRERLKV